MSYDNYDPDEYIIDDYNYCEPDEKIEEHLVLMKTNSYLVIKEEQALKLRENLIDQSNKRVELNRDELILALQYFRWNVEVFAERWFDDVEKYSEECGISQSEQSKKILSKDNILGGNSECFVCFSDKSEVELFISLSCQHYFCGDCWEAYLEEKLEEINTAIFTNCPQVNCNCIVTESTWVKVLKKQNRDNLLRIYYKACMKNFTDFNTEIKNCPSPGCESFVHCEMKSNKEVTCVCGYTFCFKCLKDGHRPCSCEMIKKWDEKNQSESENVKWMQVNTKQCPNCKKHIEKNQGCNHMTCRKEAKGCGFEFCWICLGDYKNHKSCNKFEENTEDTKTKNELKNELEKYIHYFDRYSTHTKSLKFAERMKNSMEHYIGILNTIKSVPFPDLIFLREGVQTIIESRRILRNSYVFGFYLKKGNYKSLFEHHQSLLESNADKLHGLLENDTINNLIAVDNFQEFYDNFKILKNSVIDLYTATNKFIYNLVNEIENKMMDKIDYKQMLSK